ncbi:unnamed protein product [Diamesa hyperborea]
MVSSISVSNKYSNRKHITKSNKTNQTSTMALKLVLVFAFIAVANTHNIKGYHVSHVSWHPVPAPVEHKTWHAAPAPVEHKTWHAAPAPVEHKTWYVAPAVVEHKKWHPAPAPVEHKTWYVAPAAVEQKAWYAVEKPKEEEPKDAPATYDFKYEVHDQKTGDIKRQSETSDNGSVKGQYSLVDADGYHRIVDYTADDVHGFQATVRREPLYGKSIEPEAPKEAAKPIWEATKWW